jgi:hypothetical protein
VSSQIQPHDVVGTTHWLKLSAGAKKGADAETVTGGLDLTEGRKIEKIWVELTLELISFFKNQPV